MEKNSVESKLSDKNNTGVAAPSSQSAGRKKKSALIVVGFFLAIWMMVGAGAFGAWIASNMNNGGGSILGSEFDGNTVITEEEADLASLVKDVSPSVVSIVTTKYSGSDYLRRAMEGAGTGIIISKDGYVLTNKHVVSGADEVDVISSDGSIYVGEVVGSDPLNDIAFLKIRDVDNLTPASLGDSSTVRVGQKVIAIGNSLGQYQNTVTNGIISGLGRPVVAAVDQFGTSTESLTDLLQTDTAINPGNSGGPLINMAGQVIGINTAIASDAQGIGFAIPINASKGLIRGVLKDGTIQKAYLGVQYMAITPEVRTEYKLEQKRGAYVQSGAQGSAVVSGGPADKAGIKDGDIITKVNDKEVGPQGGLGSLISEFLPGEEITLTILRDGQSREVKLTLGSYQS